MNKPYFTKWIPVEGEIKEGDTIIYTNGATQHIAEYRSPYYDKYSNLKKLKLFLCSRDIQIGDKDIHTGIMQDYGEEIVKEVKYQHQLDFMRGVSEANKTEIFKVIGEPSPKAIWVEEGMEFDEDEAKKSYMITNDPSNPSCGNHWYRFKCPTCGTFH